MVLTKRQHQVLTFLHSFMDREGYCPSYEEIAAGLNLTSLGTVHAHLQKLQQKGALRRGPNQSRSIRLTRSRSLNLPAADSLPLVGRIAAGRPLEAVQESETISLADITRNRATFVLEVRGQSMIEDHIMDGDYVLVERREQADNGEIVVALVNGVEATLKRIYREKGGMVRLQPANSAMPPIHVPAKRVQVQGRVIGVLRRY